jgi:hypothetical protein
MARVLLKIFKKNLHRGIKHMRGAEYLVIAKEELGLASAPYAPHERIFNHRQKHPISNLIRGKFRGDICLPLI